MSKAYNNKETKQGSSAASSGLVAAGLDPALVEGLKKGDPSAVAAAAEIVGNAMVQELMGLGDSAQDQIADLEAGSQKVAKTANPSRVAHEDWQEDQLDSREAVQDGQVGAEGSGEHARLSPEEADYALSLIHI